MDKRALVLGAGGQAGSYLCEHLLTDGYSVVGGVRRSSTPNTGRLINCIPNPHFQTVECDITDSHSITNLVANIRPTHLFNMAAQSHVKTSFEQPDYTFDTIVSGTLNCLEAIRLTSLFCRFITASTSEMYGDSYTEKDGRKYQDENTIFSPQSPYAIAKLAAHHLIRNYRESYGLFASTIIMFNNESPRRGDQFVTQKIIRHLQVCRWANNLKCSMSVAPKQYLSENILHLGNLHAYRDWGYTPDYVRAMTMILDHDKPDDFVVATGETHTVEQFLEESFKLVGIDDYRPYVVIDEALKRPSEVDYLCGDYSKIKNTLGWEPTVKFKDLPRIMFNG